MGAHPTAQSMPPDDDGFASGSVQRHAEIAEFAKSLSPERPRPLRRDPPPPEAFPVDRLGSVLCAAAAAIGDRVQCPPAICAQAVLGAATLATQAHADVELPTGQKRPVSNFFITVAGSGERKTSADKEALWPIDKHQATLRTEYDAELPKYRNKLDAHETARKRILDDKKRTDPVAIELALADLGPPPGQPLAPILVMSAPTLEGLHKLYPTSGPSLGIFASEGASFVGGHGMSDDAKLRTAAGLSDLWDGAPITRIRGGDGASVLTGRRLAAHLMMQPDVGARLLFDRVLVDQGLTSRLLVSAPASAAGTRLWRQPSPDSQAALDRYGARLLTILETEPMTADTDRRELRPRALPLAPAARSAWIGFVNTIERQLADGQALAPIRGFANKMPEHAARLAAVLALVDNLDAGDVSGHHIAAAIELVQHYAAEALRLYDAGQMAPELEAAVALLDWLNGPWNPEVKCLGPTPREKLVSLPDIYQRGPSRFRDQKSARSAVRTLEDHGWLAKADGAPFIINGATRRDAWAVWKPREGGR